MGTRTCVSLSKFLLPPITSSPFKIRPPSFTALVSTASRWNDYLLQLGFKSSSRETPSRNFCCEFINDQGHLFTALGRGHSSVGLVDKVHNEPCRADYTVRHTGTRRGISFITAAKQRRCGLSKLSKPSAYLYPCLIHSTSFDKAEIKTHHRTSHERPEGEMYNSTLSLTSAPDGGGWSTPRPGLFT